MKRKYLNITAATFAIVAIAVFAGSAVASSAAFAFTMNLRYVDGKKNNILHTLDAGDLTLSGKIWVTSKKARAASNPEPVTITVWKPGIVNSDKCSVSVTPDRILNQKVSFTKSCGHIESGTYFIAVSKSDAFDKSGDGWQCQGSGTLSTK